MVERFADPSEALDYFYKLLTNTKTCIILFESLEYKRTWTEWVSDWAVGERNSINKDRMTRDLKLLESSVEGVIAAYVELIKALNRVKSLNKRSEQLSLLTSDITDSSADGKSQVEILKRLDSKFANNTNVLLKELNPVTKKVAVGIGGVGGVLAVAGAVGVGVVVKGIVVAPLIVAAAGGVAITGGIVLISGVVGKLAFHSRGKDRGSQYQRVKQLYDALDDQEAIANFQTHESEIKGNTQRIQSQICDYRKLVDEALKIKKESQASQERRAQEKGNFLKGMEQYADTMKKILRIIHAGSKLKLGTAAAVVAIALSLLVILFIY